MGDVLDGVEKGLTTFLQELYKNRTASATYRRRAAEAQNQADLIAAAAQQKNTYLLQSAAEQARNVYQNYRQTQASRQNNFAASGLRGDSATVQYILKNSRFQALLDEKALAAQLAGSVAQNNAQAAEKIRALKELALANRLASFKGSSGFGIGAALSRFIGGF